MNDLTVGDPVPAQLPATYQMDLVTAIAQAAVNPAVDVEKMKALLALKREIDADAARNLFVAALAAFKRNPPRITKNKHVGFQSRKEGAGKTDYWHATLDHICDLLSGPLSAQGLSVRWETQQLDKGLIRVTCVLQHDRGHSERVTLEAGADQSGNKNSIQAVGSTVTYLQRYTMLSALGLATGGTDDDGRGGDNGREEERDDPWTDELRAAGRDAANKGLPVYQAWWKRQAETFRDAAIGTKQHADFRAAAEAA